MTVFIIKSGICMVILFGLYWLILRKEKLFIFNRFYLVFSVLFSLVVPFVSIPVDIGSQNAASEIVTILKYKPALNANESQARAFDPEKPLSEISDPHFTNEISSTNSTPANWANILLIIYLSGLMVMLARFGRNILLVINMYRRCETIEHEGYKIALLDCPVNPFSFLRTIFLNKQDYIENRIAGNVLRHELEHVRQSHSCDIILFEILEIIYWFNPVLFLYKWAARINHEYLADEAVVRSTSDKTAYAGDLINFIMCRTSVPFASGFGQSMIKKRLFMLNTNTSKWSRNSRMGLTMFISFWLMILLCIRPAYPGTQDRKNKKQITENDDIVIEGVYFRSPDFKPAKALFVMDGRKVEINDTIDMDLQNIKTIEILKDRKAIRKYGRIAKNGAVVITTYENDKGSEPDSIYFKPMYTVNNKVPEGSVTIPLSNLYSLNMWTYPIFPEQDLRKRWRTIEIMTRDYYRIRGKVIRKNGEPVAGVLVTATDNPSRITTDHDGRFYLEDVRQDAVTELSADGYEPLYFKASGMVFKTDLSITLDKKNEPDQNVKWVNKSIKDFSGRWKYNKEVSVMPSPVINYIYDIRQYGSDSIMINTSTTLENKRELNHNACFVFNTVKTEASDIFENIRSTVTCSIDTDGQSFSIRYYIRSKLGLFTDNERTDIYSLSDDGKQLIISTIYLYDASSGTGKEILKLVFDRM